MNQSFVLTVISDDKPGVVESISQAIADAGGNWQESHMTHLAGKFAGLLTVSLPTENSALLENALQALSSKGIQTLFQAANESGSPQAPHNYKFVLVGPDRAGIVREMSQAFLAHHINLAEFNSRFTSMPYSGDPLFEAKGILQVPESVDINDLEDQLDEIRNALAVDITLEQPES